jgi:hypothetical protein
LGFFGWVFLGGFFNANPDPYSVCGLRIRILIMKSRFFLYVLSQVHQSINKYLKQFLNVIRMDRNNTVILYRLAQKLFLGLLSNASIALFHLFHYFIISLLHIFIVEHLGTGIEKLEI